VTATLVRVLWPRDDAVVPLVQYTNAFINADATGVALCDFIEREGLTGKRLDFVGNSLGKRVALVAMKRLQRASRPLASTIFLRSLLQSVAARINKRALVQSPI
jgi:hypothetical protein